MQPPVFSFPAGPGKVLTFSSVTGLVSFSALDPFIGPDGDPGFHTGHTGTDIDPGGGISGIKADPGPLIFLAGVFLPDAPPAPPAPPKLDFTGNLGFTDLSPQIGQVFFVGDGLTGTGSGTVQRFYVPASATRLFLGFADAGGFHGFPGFYEDNRGSFTAIAFDLDNWFAGLELFRGGFEGPFEDANHLGV